MSDHGYVALGRVSVQRETGLTAADAAIVGPELQRLTNAGASTNADVVDAARPSEAVLHPYFEWDDTAAAEAYREHQAETITRTVRVVRRRGDVLETGPVFGDIQQRRVVRRHEAETLAPSAEAGIEIPLWYGHPAERQARRDDATRLVARVERAEQRQAERDAVEHKPLMRSEPTPIGRPQAPLSPREELVAAVLELSEWARRWSTRPHIRESLKPIYSIIAAAEAQLGLTRDERAV